MGDVGVRTPGLLGSRFTRNATMIAGPRIPSRSSRTYLSPRRVALAACPPVGTGRRAARGTNSRETCETPSEPRTSRRWDGCSLSQTVIHILYVITDLKVGGVPLHLHRLAKAMRGRGYRCGVVSLAEDMPLAERFRDDGVEVHSCHGRGGRDFGVIGRLTRLIKAVQPDIVHSLLFHANVAARRAARKARGSTTAVASYG